MTTKEQKALNDLECAFSIAENERGLEVEDSKKALAVLIAEATRRGKVMGLEEAKKMLDQHDLDIYAASCIRKDINSRIQQYGKEE